MTEPKVKQQCELCNRSFLNLKQHQTKSHKKYQIRITEQMIYVVFNDEVIDEIDKSYSAYGGWNSDDSKEYRGWDTQMDNENVIIRIWNNKEAEVIKHIYPKNENEPFREEKVYKHNIEFIFE